LCTEFSAPGAPRASRRGAVHLVLTPGWSGFRDAENGADLTTSARNAFGDTDSTLPRHSYRNWESADDGRMELRIEARDLPGRDCPPGPGFPGYRNVHVGVQRKDRPGELLEPRPGDAASASWTLDCVLTFGPAGADLRGRYIQGRPGGRFIYLSWGTVDDGGTFTMFRRAKLMLDAVDPELLRAAERGATLVGRLGLTDGRGQPRCAAVRPPVIDWSAP
jgi:hypothetical protein